jgi:membrane associated rhomboid family serine protease
MSTPMTTSRTLRATLRSMGPMDPIPPPPPATPASAPGPVACKRHPDVQTMLRCTRCGDPICPDCMQPAPVGYQCPDCARGGRQEIHRPSQNVVAAPGRGPTLTNIILLVLVAMYGVEVAAAGVGSLVWGPSSVKLIQLGADIGYHCSPVQGQGLIGVGAGQYWRLFTAIFLHAGLLHLAMNGYALWAFGNIVEQELGKTRFLVIFFVGGVFASAASFVFGSFFAPSVGASGAIFAVFGAFAGYAWRRRELSFYAARLRTVFTLIIINAVFAAGLSGVIDWRAHVGGFVGGLVLGLAADGARDRRFAPVLFGAAAIGLVVIGALLVLNHAAALQALYGNPC